MRAVPGSNILISAFLWGGVPAQILESGIIGEIELFTSEPIVRETMRVLRRKGLGDDLLADKLRPEVGRAQERSPS